MAPLVVLAGFMGSGKSSVGGQVAALLDWRFVDLDSALVRETGMPIADFFARHGEPAFRQKEIQTLKAVLGETPDPASGSAGLVLALGGGTLQSPEAVALVEAQGGVVFLDVDVELAWARARETGRPLAKEAEAFSALLSRRRPVYEGAADWVLPAGERGVEELAATIADIVRMTGDAWSASWGLQLIATERPSTIVGGPGCRAALVARAQALRAAGRRVFVVTDDNVHRAWGAEVRGLLGEAGADGEAFVLTPGETSKTVGSLEDCWEWLAARGARRDDVVLALGGGVVGDLAGFAAATYQRGVGLWQVPTSLLAQVDSSVGGKTAIDLRAGKNLAGAFYQPGLVVIDPVTLATLPGPEYVNGLGEVVKTALLAGDGLFGLLEHRRAEIGARDADLMSDIIKACVRYKAGVVAEDEFDTGRRAVLNLGHTTAHALEVTLGYGTLRHGEAVALGLLVALAVSERELGLDPAVRRRTEALLTAFGLPVTAGLPVADQLQAAAARDKKVSAASAGFVGLRSIGEPVPGMALPSALFLEALEVIRK